MAGKIRQLQFSDGVTVTPPTDIDIALQDSSNTFTAECTFDEAITAKQVSTPTNPASGYNKIYFKSDNKAYTLDSSGNEVQVGSGAGGGGINLIDDPNAESGVTEFTSAGTGITAEQETTASNCPLNPYKETCIKLTNAGSGTGYTRIRKTLPEGMQGQINHISWYQKGDGTYASGDYRISLYSNSASDYTGTYTQIPFYEDDSNDEVLINDATGKNIVHFLTNEPYLEILFERTSGAGSGSLYINELEVGTGQISTGPALDNGNVLSGSISNLTTNIEDEGGYYWRTGSRMKVEASLEFSGTNTEGAVTLTIPDSKTVDTTRIFSGHTSTGDQIPVGSWLMRDVSTGTRYSGAIYYDVSSDAIQLDNGSNIVNTNSSIPFTIADGDSINVWYEVPIAEWAGQSTAYLGSNDVEYVSNSDATDADDTTSFAYGPSGSNIPTVATATGSTLRQKRIRFQTTIQPTDRLQVEVLLNGESEWIPVEASTTYAPFYRLGGVRYGIGLEIVNETDVDVIFGRGGRDSSGATYASVGSAYPATSGDKWRVVKHRAGVPVAFGQSTATNLGLSYMSQVITGQTTTGLSDSVETDIGSSTISLPAGDYIVEYSARCAVTFSSVPNYAVGILKVTDSSNAQLGDDARSGLARSTSTLMEANTTLLTEFTLASVDTIKLRGIVGVNGGTVSDRAIRDGFIKVIKKQSNQ